MVQKSDKDQKAWREQMRIYAKYSSLGLQIMIIVIIGAFAGLKLDEKFNPEGKAFTLILTFVGIIAAFYHLFRQVLKKN